MSLRPRDSNLKNPTFDGHVFQREPIVMISRVVRGSEELAFSSVHLVAVSTMYAASKDSNLRQILDRNILVCDSTPVAKFLNLIYGDFSVCRGTDFFRFALSLEENRGSHFFLGGTDTTLESLTSRIRTEYPNIEISGTYSPPFGEYVDMDKIISIVQSSRPAYIWVGMGSPKQDFIADRISKETGIKTFAVGAAFDFFAGTVAEIPRFLRGTGLEWFYRLCLDPKRLWRRYLFGNWYFFRIVFQSFYSGARRKNR